VTPVVVRRLLVATCVAGIGGMIATSIADSPGGALTFGLATAVAAFGMILVTAVTNGGRARSDDDLAEGLEERIEALVAAGADARTVRALVRDAVRLGRQSGPPA
jgi:multisubunit Na+/H+ antiporter MnhB subunit